MEKDRYVSGRKYYKISLVIARIFFLKSIFLTFLTERKGYDNFATVSPHEVQDIK